MPMPSNTVLNTDVTLRNVPTRTYKIITEKNRVNGFTDNIDAMRQAIWLILNTERYQYPIYSWKRGIETLDLYGENMLVAQGVIQQRIIDALMQDSRITNVTNFETSHERNKLTVSFTVITIYAEIDYSWEVNI